MQPCSSRIWQERPLKGEVDKQMTRHAGLSPFLAHLLAQRGVLSSEQVELFLNAGLGKMADPRLMAGMTIAVERLSKAIAAGEKIAVHGDYDVDGISATALLMLALRDFGARVGYSIPLRQRDGYGLCGAAIAQAAADGVKVIVSVDCGINACDEAELAAANGIDLIITDHHQPGAKLPPALCCLNPHRADDRYPDKYLCGVGVAFMLVVALRSHLRQHGLLGDKTPDIRYLLDLVCLGTIADIVPLLGVNRLLVKAGLRLLNGTCRPGLAALKQVAKVTEVSAGQVGYRLAPRLNAAGRLEDAAQAVELLLCNDNATATQLARRLDACNSERRTIEAQIQKEATQRVADELDDDAYTIVLADERWHAGVIGIVASRLVEIYHRPVVLIALGDDGGKGSARSVRGFDLYRAFEHCAGHLRGYGGHKYAAGLTIATADVAAFAAAFEQYARKHISAKQRQGLLEYDAEVLLQDVSDELLTEMKQLEPFGAGNPSVVLLCRGVHAQDVRVVGKKHLKFIVWQDGYSHPAIFFNSSERRSELDGKLDILFSAAMNNWNNRSTLQLTIKDVRAASD